MSAGRDAPPLRTLTVTVPRYLRVASRHGVSVTSTAAKPARLPFTDHATRSDHADDHAAPGDHPGPGAARAPEPALGRAEPQPAALATGSRVPLTLSVTDASSGQSKLTPKVTVAA